MTRVSYFGLISVVSFIILAFIGRIVFPFGDEPDWIVRAPQVLFDEHPIWSPYSLFSSWFNLLDIDASRCQVNAGALSLWAYIPQACSESFSQVVVRWFTMVFVLLPLILILIFRWGFIQAMNLLNVKLSSLEWNLRIDTLGISLVFPGMLFYLGVLAEEQLFLVGALYIFLFWGFWKVIFVLLIFLLAIDFGNSIVAIFYVLSMLFFIKLRNVSRNLFFLGISLFVFFALFVDYRILEFFIQLDFLPEDFNAKSESMFNAFDGSELLTKYPILLRPVVTFISFIFMTPSGVKVPLLYIVYFLLFSFISMRTLRIECAKLDLYWFVPLAVIVFFVFLFPTYANAKYYIFMMPFFIYVALRLYDRAKVLLISSSSSLFVFLSLLMYRI
jgi:hypothetical protein